MKYEQLMTILESKTGQRIRVRRIKPGDTTYLVDIFEHMGSESRYRRFHQPLDNPSPQQVWQEAERIAQADPQTNHGLIAFADLPVEPNVPIGAARYVCVTPGVAEIAISIRDDMQGQGIGTHLLRLLTESACETGLTKLVGTIQNNNEAMWRVMDRLDFPFSRAPQGTESEVEIDLTMRKGGLRATAFRHQNGSI